MHTDYRAKSYNHKSCLEGKYETKNHCSLSPTWQLRNYWHTKGSKKAIIITEESSQILHKNQDKRQFDQIMDFVYNGGGGGRCWIIWTG